MPHCGCRTGSPNSLCSARLPRDRPEVRPETRQLVPQPVKVSTGAGIGVYVPQESNYCAIWSLSPLVDGCRGVLWGTRFGKCCAGIPTWQTPSGSSAVIHVTRLHPEKAATRFGFGGVRHCSCRWIQAMSPSLKRTVLWAPGADLLVTPPAGPPSFWSLSLAGSWPGPGRSALAPVDSTRRSVGSPCGYRRTDRVGAGAPAPSLGPQQGPSLPTRHASVHVTHPTLAVPARPPPPAAQGDNAPGVDNAAPSAPYRPHSRLGRPQAELLCNILITASRMCSRIPGLQMWKPRQRGHREGRVARARAASRSAWGRAALSVRVSL